MIFLNFKPFNSFTGKDPNPTYEEYIRKRDTIDSINKFVTKLRKEDNIISKLFKVMSFNLIPKYYTLYPEVQCSQYLYFHDEHYAYWLENSENKVYEWVLFKEYNDYKSVCYPNDCIAAISYNDLIESFKNDHFYDNMDREKLCRTFRQRSLETEFEPNSKPYWNFEDFIDEDYILYMNMG